jgi:hypothetical protein
LQKEWHLFQSFNIKAKIPLMSPIYISMLHAPVISLLPNIILYIDPGTGSIILQAVAAAIAGVAIAAKIYWHSLLKFLGLRKEIKPDTSVPEDHKE